ncbi:hypothetical protein [Chroococcus sp. FPU101]|uniref:hypothetical protein n=1 Tax=Chroococcus sp. FPU101 TaxID=1974212 RepID=UPI001F5CA004|nr:hypothetical protein [Chroococcus sp. FPU101]
MTWIACASQPQMTETASFSPDLMASDYIYCKQRYRDQVFQDGDVIGGILINLPLEG